MAEYGSIPARLNGIPIPALGQVQVTMQRNVTQNPTTTGVKITYGKRKYQAQLTFPNLKDKALFLVAIGADEDSPEPHNLGYDLGGKSFSLLNGIASGTTASSDQDGQASVQVTVMYEGFQAE